MIKEAYEQGFLEACDEYGLDEDDMEVLEKVAKEIDEGLVDREARSMRRATSRAAAGTLGYIEGVRGGILGGLAGVARGHGKTGVVLRSLAGTAAGGILGGAMGYGGGSLVGAIREKSYRKKARSKLQALKNEL